MEIEKIQIDIKLADGAKMPHYATDGSAGFDLVAHNFKKLFKGKKEIDLTKELQSSIEKGFVMMRPFERLLVGTGLFFQIPRGYEVQVRGRSGVSLKTGLVVIKGTIDSDYTGEVGIILHNSSQFLVEVKLKDRLAQGILAKVEQAQFKQVTELVDTERGANGFGHTGMK